MPSVRCRGLDIYYEDHGSGTPIVWIPGTGLRGRRGSTRCGVRGPLPLHHRRPAGERGDQRRGHRLHGGRPGPGRRACWTLSGVDRAVIAGLSLGSAVAQELALARPDLVAGLVLLATWSSTAREHHIRRHFESRLYALENGPIDVYAQFAFWMSSPWLYDHEPTGRRTSSACCGSHMSTTPAGTAGHFRADLRHETRDRLPRSAARPWWCTETRI